MSWEWIIAILLTVLVSVTIIPVLYVLFYEKVITRFTNSKSREGLLAGVAALITGIAAMTALARTDEIGTMISDLKITSIETQQSVADVIKAINELRTERKFIAIDRSFRPTSPLLKTNPSDDEIEKFLKLEYGHRPDSVGALFIPDKHLEDVSRKLQEQKDPEQRKFILQQAVEFDMEKK